MLYLNIWEDIGNGAVRQFVADMATGIPRFFMALLVLIVGLLIARLARLFTRKLLLAVGIDRIATQFNDIDIVQSSRTSISLAGIIAQVVYVFLVLMTLMAVTDVLHIAALSEMVKRMINYLPSLLTAGAMLLFGILLSELLRNVVLRTCQSLGIPSAKMIALVVFYFGAITVIISALGQAQIDTSFISANLTVVIGAIAFAFALGYGLASKALMANYLAGQYHGDRIRIGDEVSVEGMRGKVVMIDSTALTLQTEDRAIVVPMSKLTTEKIEIFYPDGQDERLLEEGV